MQIDAAEPIWLSAADVVDLNMRTLSGSTENHLVLNLGLLEGALCRPKNSYQYAGTNDIIELGVITICAVGKCHAFENGNKRTAFHAGLIFIEDNGVYLDLLDADSLGQLVTDAIIGNVQETDLVNLFRSKVI